MAYIQNTGYWTFFCNPKKWAIDEFLAENNETNTNHETDWKVTSWQAKDFALGQLGVIRVGNDTRTKAQLGTKKRLQAGIYAIVAIRTSASAQYPKPDKYWLSDDEKSIKKQRVSIRILENLLDHPITIEQLKIIGVEDSYLLKGFRAASMPLQKQAFQRIRDELGYPLQIPENISTDPVAKLEDIVQLEQKYAYAVPEVKEIISKRIERGPLSNQFKQRTGYKCQVCEALGLEPLGFKKTNDEFYIETHHVTPVSSQQQGVLGIQNLMTVCPNHHRQIHYGDVELLQNSTSHFLFKFDGQELTIQKPKHIYETSN